MIVTRSINEKPISQDELSSLNIINPTIESIFTSVVKRIKRDKIKEENLSIENYEKKG